jgi:hypothetical protein
MFRFFVGETAGVGLTVPSVTSNLGLIVQLSTCTWRLNRNLADLHLARSNVPVIRQGISCLLKLSPVPVG